MSDPKTFRPPEDYGEFLFKRHEDRVVDPMYTHDQAAEFLELDALEPVLRSPDHRDPLYVKPLTVREQIYAALFRHQITMKEAIKRYIEERKKFGMQREEFRDTYTKIDKP